MEVELLLSCTIEVLQLLINLYDKNKIDYMTFMENTEIKIKFLKDHLECIKNPMEMSAAKFIIDRCEEIFMKY